MSDWDEYDSYWSDLYESDGGEYEYEEALELLPGGSEETDVEKAIELMMAAALGGYRLAQSWLENCLSQYLDYDDNIKEKWRRKRSKKKDEGQKVIPPSDAVKAPDTPKAIVHEPGYYEELHLGILERDPDSFTKLYDLCKGNDPLACFYMGIFLEKVEYIPAALHYARKWFQHGIDLGNRDCIRKCAIVEERISNLSERCPKCSSKNSPLTEEDIFYEYTRFGFRKEPSENRS